MGAFDRPPKEWDSGPFPQGEPRIRYFDEVRNGLDPYCRQWGVGLPQETASRYINACYVAALNTIALPNPQTWPGGEREVAKMRRHEEGHARGGYHGSRESTWVPADWYVRMMSERPSHEDIDMQILAGER